MNKTMTTILALLALLLIATNIYYWDKFSSPEPEYDPLQDTNCMQVMEMGERILNSYAEGCLELAITDGTFKYLIPSEKCN